MKCGSWASQCGRDVNKLSGARRSVGVRVAFLRFTGHWSEGKINVRVSLREWEII